MRDSGWCRRRWCGRGRGSIARSVQALGQPNGTIVFEDGISLLSSQAYTKSNCEPYRQTCKQADDPKDQRSSSFVLVRRSRSPVGYFHAWLIPELFLGGMRSVFLFSWIWCPERMQSGGGGVRRSMIGGGVVGCHG